MQPDGEGYREDDDPDLDGDLSYFFSEAMFLVFYGLIDLLGVFGDFFLHTFWLGYDKFMVFL